MAGPEARFKMRFVKKLREYGHIQPIESITAPGIPDVNGCIDGIEFWIELKYFPIWPRKKFNSKLSEYQKLWLRTRWKNGGKAFYLAQIEKDYLFLMGKTVMEIDGEYPMDVICQGKLWEKGINYEELISYIKR